MTIATQLKIIRDALDKWARTRKGHAHIAGDPYDMFSMLRMTPGGIRVVVMFHSELKRGEYEESGFVDRTFWVGLSRGRGMKLTPGQDMVEQSAGGPPLFDLIEEARQAIRNISFESTLDIGALRATTEDYPNYKGTNPFQMEGYLMDAYNLEFSIGVQLPAPDDNESTSAATPP